jgi:hypothetical protein
MEIDDVDAEAESGSYWLKFLLDAGIPSADATNYAVIFTNHRIQPRMISDLNKEYLMDMGIHMMGDIIAILNQAKSVNSCSGSQVNTNRTGRGSPTVGQTGNRSTAASRIIGHYTGRTQTERSTRLNESMQSGESSVFGRLGGGLSVRNRLGTTTVVPELNDVSVRKTRGGKVGKVKGPLRKVGSDNVARTILETLGMAGSDRHVKPSTVSQLHVTVERQPDTDDSSNDSPLPYAGVFKLTSDSISTKPLTTPSLSKVSTQFSADTTVSDDTTPLDVTTQALDTNTLSAATGSTQQLMLTETTDITSSSRTVLRHSLNETGAVDDVSDTNKAGSLSNMTEVSVHRLRSQLKASPRLRCATSAKAGTVHTTMTAGVLSPAAERLSKKPIQQRLGSRPSLLS